MADDPATFQERFTGQPDQPQREGGLLQTAPQAIEELSTPEGRSKFLTGLEKFPAHFAEGILDFFKTPGIASKQGLTPDQEVEFGLNAALGTIGAEPFKVPKGMADGINAFHEQVLKPAAERLTANPDAVSPVINSDVPSTVSRSQLALTGEPHIDAILNSPVTKDVIDNPVVNRQYDVPYTAGGSTPLQDPTMFIDRRFPRAFSVDGKVFDPADPFTIHENVEQHAMDILQKGGMDQQTAYKVAHWEFAEKAEGAWYDAHGIDQAKAEAAYKPYLDAIQKEGVIAYHGTPKQFENFDFNRPLTSSNTERGPLYGWGFFSPTKELAGRFTGPEGRIITVRIHDPDLRSHTFDVVDMWKNDPSFKEDIRKQFTKSPAVWAQREQRIDEAIKNGAKKLPLAGGAIDAVAERANNMGLDVALVKGLSEGDQYMVRNAANVEKLNFPPNLYKDPYPHDSPFAAAHEALGEPRPTEAEINQAKKIIGDWQNKPPDEQTQPVQRPTVNPLAEARSLGVIGPDRPDLLRMEPRQAAMAATQDVLRGPKPGEPTAWRLRWEKTLDKMQTPADARKVISSIVDANDEFAPARQGDLTAGQVEQLGLVSGLDTTRIDVKGTSAKIKTNVEMRNTIEAFVSLNKKIKAAAVEVADKRGIGDDVEAAELMRLEMQRDLLIDATTSTKEFAALRAEFGRLGNVLQEYMRVSKEANTFRDFVKKNGGSMDDIRDRARIIADTDDRAIPRVLNPNSRAKGNPWYFHIWQNFLISGLITHTKYAVVNTAQLALNQVFSPFVSAVIDRSMGRDSSLAAPVWAYASTIHGFPYAIRGAAAAFKSGERVPLISEMELAERGQESPQGAIRPYDTGNKVNWGIWKRVFNEDQLAKAEAVTGVFGRSANAMHTFYKILGEQGSLGLQAYQKAYGEKLKTNAEFWQRYEYHYANPTDDVLRRATGEAYDGTFMAKMGPEMTRLAGALKSNPVLRWLFPFMHIPEEIARTAIRYSPLAGFGPEMRQQLLGDRGQATQSLALAKVVIGTAAIGYFATRALSGDLTGAYPVDQKERARWKLLNIQPNSIRADGEWHSIERLGPPGILLGLTGDLAHVWQHYDVKDDKAMATAIAGLGIAFANALANDVGFQSMKNLIDLFEGEDPARWMGYEASTLFIPSLVRQQASLQDPYMRQTKSILDGLKYATPFLRETLPPKRDPLYGEPMPNPGYHTFGRSVPATPDPIKQELDAVGYHPSYPKPHVGGVELKGDALDKYEATAGPVVKSALGDLIASPQWKSGDPVWRKNVARTVVSTIRRDAAKGIQIDDPGLIVQGIINRHRQVLGRNP